MTLLLSIAPIEAMPGTPSRARVDIRNDGSAPTFVSLSVAGIDAGWVTLPSTIGPVGPGESTVAEIAVVVPAGHPACELTGAVTARSGTGELAQADLAVNVLDGSVLSAVLDPADVRGGMRGRASLILRNRGASPVRVDLEATAPEPELRVRFKGRTRVVQAGQEVRIPARLSAPRPVFGALRHRPFVVSVRTRGTPVQLEGAFLQRAVLAPWMTKVLAIVAVVALWATVAVVGISSITKQTNKTAQQKALNNAPPVTAPPGPSAANPSGAANPAAPAGGGGGAAGGGAGGGGAAGGGSGGGSSSGSGGGSGAAVTAAGASSRVTGKVSAGQPGGVTVTMQPASGGAASNQVATVSSAPAANFVLAAATFSGRLTKLYGADLPAVGGSRPASTIRPPASSPAQPVVSSYSTTTSPDGFWTFSSVPPGSYTVSFSKPGYSVASYVVTVTGNGQAISLPSKLVPGNGSASGTVRDNHGPLGGVQLTITDGTVTLSTRTPTTGKVGTWAVNGLPTPGTYLVTATDPGYSRQTTLFTLGVAGNAGGLQLTMVPGEGSLSGTIVSARDGRGQGGLTVTASDGTTTQTTTTTTTGAVGTYNLPNLPVPGTYALTISGPGFVTQTQQAVLTSATTTDNATVNALVTPSAADVSGVATDANGQGLPAAGAILFNQTNVFKTLTTSSGTVGSFDFSQVPPGSYVLSVEDFGYTTESAQVTVASGQVQTVNLSLPTAENASLATATIQGSVDSLLTSKPIIGAQISIDGQPTSATTNAVGSYLISNVNPGAHTISASCPGNSTCQSMDLITGTLVKSGFQTTTSQVSVALGAVTFAQAIFLPKLDQLAGIVMDGTGQPVANPTITLTNTASGIAYTQTGTPVASGVSAAKGGFQFDDLPFGSYTMTITGPAPPAGSGNCPAVQEYKPLTTALNLQVDTDYLLTGAPGLPNASPVLTVLPQYKVRTEVAQSNGTAKPTTGITVEVKATTPGVTYDQVCTEQTAEPIVELPAGDTGDTFQASFSYAVGATQYNAPASAPFQAQNNNVNEDVALLVPPTPNISVTMSFPWRQPSATVTCVVTTTGSGTCPSLQSGDLPSLSLTGSVSQPGGGTAPGTFTATPDATHTIWTFPSASLAGLLPGAVTFKVNGGAFQTFSKGASTTDNAFTTQAFALAPNLSTVQGTLTSPASGTAITVSPLDPNLVVSQSGSDLVWQVTGQQSRQAMPGVYDLTFSQSGYDSTVVNGFTVGLCDSTCTATLGVDLTSLATTGNTLTYKVGSSAISLDAHQTLTVTPEIAAGYPTLPFPTATVTVTNKAGTVVGTAQVSASNQTASFPNLSATYDNYTVKVTAANFATSNTSGVVLPAQTTAATDAMNPEPTLQPLGYITGLVQGVVHTSSTALVNATVTGTLSNASGCSAGVPSTITGKTLADGTFTLSNTGDPNYPGLCVGSVYSVAVTAPTGYGTASTYNASVTVGPGANAVNSGAPIQLEALPVNQTILVKDDSGVALPAVLVSASSIIGTPIQNQYTADGTLGTVAGEISVTPDPATYTYTFQLAGYGSQSRTVTYTVGEGTAPQMSVTMTVDRNTITGVVSAPGRCPSTSVSPCGLPNVALTLLDSNNTTVLTTTSSSSGSYSFASTSSLVIRDGNYTVEAVLSGWQTASGYQPGLVTSPSLTTVKNVSMIPNPVGLTVTISSNLTSIPLSGNTVSLVPASPASGRSLACSTTASPPTLPAIGEGTTQTATVALFGGSYVATFPSVVPDYYTLTVQGSGLPFQGDDAVIVCPGGGVAEYAPATASSATYTTGTAVFETLAGQITGTVAVSGNSKILPSALDVYIAPASGSGTYDTVFATCANASCTLGQFTSDLLALGPSYNVTAQGPSGYANSTAASVDFSSSTTLTPWPPTGPTAIGSTLTVAPSPIQVTLTVDDVNASPAAPVDGLTITLSDTTISGDSALHTVYTGLGDAFAPYTATTQLTNGHHGVATFQQVVPDPNGTYSISAASNAQPVNLQSGSSSVTTLPLTVSIGAGSTTQTIDAYYGGSISGTVYDANVQNDSVYLCHASSCTSGSANQTVTFTSASGSSSVYTFSDVAPGSWSVSSSAVGSGSTPASVTPGSATTGVDFVAQGGISGHVYGKSGDQVTVHLYTYSSATSPAACTTTSAKADQSVTIGNSGSANYSFTGLTTTASGEIYCVISDLSGSTDTNITVMPGATEPGPDYYEPGGISGSATLVHNESIHAYVCSSSSCSASSPSLVQSTPITGSGSGTGTYSFTGLPITSGGASGETYYVASDIIGGTTTSVTVNSGVTNTSGPTLQAGEMTGTVNGKGTPTVYLCPSSTDCTTSALQTATVTADSGGNGFTYLFSRLAPSSSSNKYYVFSTGNFLDSGPNSPVTVSAGADVTGPTYDEPGTITGTVNGQSTPTVYLCPSSTDCTTSALQTATVTANSGGNSFAYLFSGLAPSSSSNKYYVFSTGNYLHSGPLTAVSVPGGGNGSGPTYDEPATISGIVNGGAATNVYLCNASPCTATTKGVQDDAIAAGIGTYSFPSLPPGSYYIGSPSNYVAGALGTQGPFTVQGLPITGPTFDEPANLSVTVSGLTGSASVTFCVATGTATSCGGASSVQVKSNGTSTLGSFPPGAYTVIASASSGGSVTPPSQSVSLSAGEAGGPLTFAYS